MKYFNLLTLFLVLTLVVSCSSSSDDGNNPGDVNTPSDPTLLVAKGEDFLSTTENEEATYNVSGSKEFYDDGRKFLTEFLDKPFRVKINIPKSNPGVSIQSAGYYKDEYFLYTMPFAFYFRQNSGIWGIHDNPNDAITILPQEIKVGTEWTVCNEKSDNSSDQYTSTHLKNFKCKVLEYYSKYTTSNQKKYSDVIKVEFAAIDTSYVGYYIYNQDYYYRSQCEYYNGYVYLAKGVGPVEGQSINSYKLDKAKAYEAVEKYNVTMTRK